MKWFQHLTTAQDDEDLTALLERHGAEGYGVYWMLGELVGRNVKDHTDAPETEMLRATWARKCYVSERKFDQIVTFLHRRQKIDVRERVEGRHAYVTIRHEKVLKYCDEWIKKLRSKSGATPESLGTNSGVTPAKESKERKERKERKGIEAPGGPSLEQGPQAQQVDPEQLQRSRAMIKEAIRNLPDHTRTKATTGEINIPEEEAKKAQEELQRRRQEMGLKVEQEPAIISDNDKFLR
jgi:hypothetical protein